MPALCKPTYVVLMQCCYDIFCGYYVAKGMSKHCTLYIWQLNKREQKKN